MLLSKFYDKGVIIDEHEFMYLGILDSKVKGSILSFIEDFKYINSIKKNVSMLLTTSEIYTVLKDMDLDCGFCICTEPRIEFFKLHNELSTKAGYKRESFDTIIGNGCNISPLSYISPNNVIIGKNVIIEEFVSIKDNTIIGDNSIIRAGSIIGGSGFEFKKDGEKQFGVEHLGVVIQDHVEIQYNCCIDKALYPWDDTIIGEYTKVDNLIHIAHAVKIGKKVLLPAGTTIGGRVEIGDNVWIGVGSVISNSVIFEKILDAILDQLLQNVPENGNVTGNFAIDHQKFIANLKKIDKRSNNEN